MPLPAICNVDGGVETCPVHNDSAETVPCHFHHCCVRRRRSLAGPSPIRGVTVIALRRFLAAKLGRETLQAVMHLPGYPMHHMLDFFNPRLTYGQCVQDTAVFTCVSCTPLHGALLPVARPACPWHLSQVT